ncbi:MAG: hypothetical protein JW881_03980 [Spirochaetales bacterium]|nr:hypothetical protein [Spirochaetales bacterium]
MLRNTDETNLRVCLIVRRCAFYYIFRITVKVYFKGWQSVAIQAKTAVPAITKRKEAKVMSVKQEDCLQTARIDKQYVHKYNEENVFLCNIRRALPKYFSKYVYESVLIPQLDEYELKLINTYYKPHCMTPLFEGEDIYFYVLNGIPLILTPDTVAEMRFGNEQLEVIHRYYERGAYNNNLYLKQFLYEPDETILYRVFGKRIPYIDSATKTHISQILEKTNDIEKTGIYYTNLLVNPYHYFFFEHPNEHLPGMMLIEAARQFMIACGHLFGKIPLKGCQFVLSNFGVEFMRFTELNYPITIRGDVEHIKYNRHGYVSETKVSISILQNVQTTARLHIDARIINEKLFRRFRENEMREIAAHRFELFPEAQYMFTLKNPDTPEYSKTSIINISLDGMCIEQEETVSVIDKTKEYEFMLATEDIGFINGRCMPIWQTRTDGNNIVGLKFTSVQANEKRKIAELIKKRCRVVEKRFFF